MTFIPNYNRPYVEEFRDPLWADPHMQSTMYPKYGGTTQVLECPSDDLYSYYEESGNYPNYNFFKGGESADEPCARSLMTSDPSYMNQICDSQASVSAELRETNVSRAFRDYYEQMDANRDLSLVNENQFSPRLHSSNPDCYWGGELDNSGEYSLHYSMLEEAMGGEDNEEDFGEDEESVNAMNQGAIYEYKVEANKANYLFDGENMVKMTKFKKATVLTSQGRNAINKIMWKTRNCLRGD